MKTIITSSGPELTSLFDKRFGRSAWYCMYIEETGETQFYKNDNTDIPEGAGRIAVEKMQELGAQKVISGDFGTNVQELAEKASIQMVVIQGNNSTVQDIIEMIK
jgi:predicted Fe-Mo cluster-binding NifX family protein